MIANLSDVQELSPSQAETIAGGYRVVWGNKEYDATPTNKIQRDADWTVTWVRNRRGREQGTPDIFNFSLRETGTSPTPSGD